MFLFLLMQDNAMPHSEGVVHLLDGPCRRIGCRLEKFRYFLLLVSLSPRFLLVVQRCRRFHLFLHPAFPLRSDERLGSRELGLVSLVEALLGGGGLYPFP